MEHPRGGGGKSLRVLIAHAWGHLAAKCGRGCKERELRARWGCDAPATPPGYGLACYVCGVPADPECRACKGTGQIGLPRCPRFYAGRRGVDRVYTVWARLRRYRALPIEGGMMRQAHVFLEAADVLEAAWGRAEAREVRSSG